MAQDLVPVIDIGPFIRGEAGAADVVKQVRRACEETGFLIVSGHGIAHELIEKMRSEAMGFFEQPLERKVEIKRPSPEISRGYNVLGDQALSYTLGVASPPDLQESFAIGPFGFSQGPYYQTELGRIFFAENLWPSAPPELSDTLRTYYRSLERLAADIMRIFASALDLDETFFENKIDRAISLLRVIKYPPQTEAPKEGQLRAGAHTDYGTLTILHGDDTPGGLQVQNKAGEWVDVHPPAGCFIVNIGDLMMQWTNDRWRSTMHRVVNPPPEHASVPRISLVFFHQPNYDAEVRCIESCLKPGEAPKYEPVLSGEHWLGKHMKARHMKADYQYGQKQAATG